MSVDRDQARIRAHADQMRATAMRIMAEYENAMGTSGQLFEAVQALIDGMMEDKCDPMTRIVGMFAEIGISETLAQFEMPEE